MAVQNNPENDKVISFFGELSEGESALGISYISADEPGYKLLFNPVTTLNGVSASRTIAGLSAVSGGQVGVDLTIEVDTAYHNTPMAVVNPKRVSTYTPYNSSLATQSVTANGFGAVSPTLRRLVTLGYV